jgi:hypothetical protein
MILLLLLYRDVVVENEDMLNAMMNKGPVTCRSAGWELLFSTMADSDMGESRRPICVFLSLLRHIGEKYWC